MIRIGLVGARGHVGSELIRLFAGHPGLELAFVASRERAGQEVDDHHPEAAEGLRYSDAPRMILSRSDLDRLWQGGERAFLLARRTRLAELGLSPAHSILTDGGRALISNVP